MRVPTAVLAVSALVAVAGSGCSKASAFESFTLDQHDIVLAETYGCHAECRVMTPTQRTCVVREIGCRAVCTPIPQCRPDGDRGMKVCAVVKDRP